MKKIILILVIAAAGCAAPKPAILRLRVTHIIPNGYSSGIKEVWARNSYRVYMAQCQNLSDTVKVGTVLTVLPYNGQPDSLCNCVFKRIK